jgi:hypothetical protein
VRIVFQQEVSYKPGAACGLLVAAWFLWRLFECTMSHEMSICVSVGVSGCVSARSCSRAGGFDLHGAGQRHCS